MPTATSGVLLTIVGTATRDLLNSSAAFRAAGLRSAVISRELGHHVPHGLHRRRLNVLQGQGGLVAQLLTFTRRIMPFFSRPLQRHLRFLVPDPKRSSTSAFVKLDALTTTWSDEIIYSRWTDEER